MAAQRPRPRVLIVGLDGGTFSIIDPLVAEGRLPHLAGLMQAGVRGTLTSTIPPLTPVAWGTFMTGCGPGKHGTFGFLRVKPEDYSVEFLNGGSLRLPTLWQLISRAGLRCGVHNVPWTYPPQPVDGFVLSGLDAPRFDPSIAHPKGLFERVVSATGSYFEKFVPPAAVAKDVGRLGRQVAEVGQTVRWLAAAEPVDILMTVFGTTDHVQHNFWSSRAQGRGGERVKDVIHYAYERVDEEVGRLLDECADSETTVLVISDHGAGPCKGGLNLDRWLAERGWLTLRNAREAPTDTLRRLALETARRFAPRRWRDRLQGYAPQTRERLASARMTHGIDWERSRAYVWSDYGNLQLNVCGRQAAGVVEPGEPYAAAREELREALLDLRDGDGGPVVGAVHRAEEVFDGPYLDDAPDLVVETLDYTYEIITHLTTAGPMRKGIDDKVFAPALRSGTHRKEGILIAAGPPIRRAADAQTASIADLAPTILHLLGLAVPTYMDGRVLEEILDHGWLQQHPPSYQDESADETDGTGAYSAEEAREIEKHLRDLGYV